MINSKEIISQFPNIKLSYETVIHKKVYKSDIIFAIPKGKKCFAWFTYYLNSPICFLLDGTDIRIVHVSFKHDLSNGTIFYGTIFNKTFFTIEDIYYYKGANLTNYKWIDKLEILNTIMREEIKQVSYSSEFVIFGLPLLSNDVNDILQSIKTINYPVMSLKFMLFSNFNRHLTLHLDDLKKNNNVSNNNVSNNNISNNNISNNKQNNYKKTTIYNKVFTIKPDLQNDIYHMYCYDKDKMVYYNTALVPNYKTSVMLNNLFRTIKENANLDALEESDDETEFQNENIDRHVDLNKSYNMECEYNYKFKNWTPVKVVAS